MSAGELVEKGQSLATNYTILGEVQNALKSPTDGIVLGMATMPAVKPGEPVCHIAMPEGGVERIRESIKTSSSDQDMFHQVREDLATNVDVIEAEE